MTTKVIARGAALLVGAAILSGPASAQQPLPEAVSPLVQAYNQSGHDLFRKFAQAPGNIVMSPYSIGTAMAMVLSGARGETRDEMLAALRHTLAPTDIAAANEQALALLAAYNDARGPCPRGFEADGLLCKAPAPDNPDQACRQDGKREGNTCIVDAPPADVKLRLANALMLVNAAASVAPDFEETMRTRFGAEVFRGASLEPVNDWANKKTEGKIDKILDKLSQDSSHVLLNAIYFNGPWATPFPKSATRDRPFRLTPKQSVDVPSMSMQTSLALVKAEGFSAIRLPYAAEGLSMIVVRPDDIDGIDKVIAGLDGAGLAKLAVELRETEPRRVMVMMPRFKAAYGADLVTPFKALGMSKVFDYTQSDLSGLTGVPRSETQSAIDQIVHRAVIDVSETGTEAAAVTAVVVNTRRAIIMPDTFNVDRPFMFLIADDKTGAILFEGRISDPRS